MACRFRFHRRVLASAQIVGASSLQARPLGGGTSIGTQRVHNVPLAAEAIAAFVGAESSQLDNIQNGLNELKV